MTTVDAVIPQQEHGTYKPLSSVIPKEQAEKLSGLSLVQLEQSNEEPEKEEEIPVEQTVQEETPAEEVTTQEVTEEPEKEVKKETVKIESPLGDVEIPTERKEVKPEEDDETKAKEDFKAIAGSQKKQEQAFINLRRELKEQKLAAKEVVALRQQIEELKARPPEIKVDPEFQTRYEALDQEYKKAQEELATFRKDAAIYRVEKTDEYINKVDRPFKEEVNPVIIDLTKATNGAINKNTFDALAQMDPVQYREEMRKLRETMEVADYNELAAAVPKYRQIIKDNTALRQNADKMIALQQKEQEEMMEGGKKEYLEKLGGELKTRDEALAKQLFAGVEDPDLKGMIESSRKQMEDRLKSFQWYEAPVEAQAAVLAGVKNYPIVVAIMGKQIETLESKLADAQKENKSLKQEQEKINKASPSAGVTSGGASKTDVEPEEFKGKLDASTLFKMERQA